MARIFISYARKHELFARRLATSLSNSGADIWIDVEDIPPGMKWSTAIQQGLDAADLLLVIITPESMNSTNVEDEWQYFLDKHKPVIPILLQNADIHFQLNRLQYVDFLNQDYETAFSQLFTTLKGKGRQFELDAPESPTPDKQSTEQVRHPKAVGKVMGISGIILLVAAIGVVVALLATLANNTGGTSTTPVSTTAIVRATTETATLSGFQELQTEQARQTVVSNATQVVATETAARITLIALSATPTPTVTDTPDATATLMAFRPQHNDEWTPVEYDFDGFTMVLVPAGCFMMGSEDGSVDERPVNKQCFDVPFWIDKTEVTNAQYGSTEFTSNQASQPRNFVSWHEAHDFCEGRGGRLPTEAEWEYAARGPDALVYPWGNIWNPDNASWGGASRYVAFDVGSFPDGVSWIGALDMSGNVWEWTSSLYQDYPYDASDGRENTESAVDRVVHGGSFGFSALSLRSASRDGLNPVYVGKGVGFRCVRDVDAE